MPAWGCPGSQVALVGTGFSATSPLTFKVTTTPEGGTFATLQTIPSSCTTTSDGAIPSPVTFALPDTPGPYVISVADSAGTTGYATCLVMAPFVALAPWQGPTGDAMVVGLSGSGFSPLSSLTVSMETSPGSGTFNPIDTTPTNPQTSPQGELPSGA